MAERDDNTTPAVPSRGIPAAVRRRLKDAVRSHVAEHGSRKSRGLLREDPEFSAWIGKDVGRNGETGDKRLDRLFQEVKREASRSRRVMLGGLAEVPQDPVSQLLDAGAPPMGHAELQAHLRNLLMRLGHAMEACTGADSVDLLLKLSREHRAIVRDGAYLARSFNADLKSADLQTRLLKAVFESHAEDLEKAEALAHEIDEIFHDLSGLQARGMKR